MEFVKFSFFHIFRGEIKELFEKVTKDELEKSILSGDQKKQDQMRYLIEALPFHSEEIDTLEKLAKKVATTQAPLVEPEIPSELRKLLKDYGLLDKEGNPIELAPLPVSPNADHPSSLLVNNANDQQQQQSSSFEELQEQVQTAALVSAKDYETFKLIEGNKQNVSSDMETFLKQFGLVDNEDTRKRKTVKGSKPSASAQHSIDAAYLIPGYSSLLDNIGIMTTKDKNGKKIVAKAATGKPDYKKAGNDDYKKLEQLLETIRELERLNATLTEKEVDRLNLNNYNLSEKLLSEGPDPLRYHIDFSELKNEVKRQNPTEEPTKISLELNGPLLESSLEATDDGKDNDAVKEVKATVKTTTTTTTTAKPKTTTAAAPKSTTEQAKKNSLEDELEPIEDPAPLPPPRRSGFYMLFDWNSFLEVGEDPDKIVVRFDPKIGDATRFLPVNIP